MIDWRNTIALLLVGLSFSGCKPDFTAETKAVDSLLGVVEAVERSAAEIDRRLIKQYIKNIEDKCGKIQSELTDTLDLNTAQNLVDFCALKDHLENCLDRKERIDAEVLATRNQLFNLKTDLASQVAVKDSLSQFIESEFLYVESLDEGVDQLITELNGCFETYAELKDEIDRLLIALPDKTEE